MPQLNLFIKSLDATQPTTSTVLSDSASSSSPTTNISTGTASGQETELTARITSYLRLFFKNNVHRRQPSKELRDKHPWSKRNVLLTSLLSLYENQTEKNKNEQFTRNLAEAVDQSGVIVGLQNRANSLLLFLLSQPKLKHLADLYARCIIKLLHTHAKKYVTFKLSSPANANTPHEKLATSIKEGELECSSEVQQLIDTEKEINARRTSRRHATAAGSNPLSKKRNRGGDRTGNLELDCDEPGRMDAAFACR